MTLEAVEKAIREALPDVATKLDPPKHAGGFWWLTARRSDRVAAVQWRPGNGFGVALVVEDAGYNDPTDDVYADGRMAASAVVHLLRGDR